MALVRLMTAGAIVVLLSSLGRRRERGRLAVFALGLQAPETRVSLYAPEKMFGALGPGSLCHCIVPPTARKRVRHRVQCIPATRRVRKVVDNRREYLYLFSRFSPPIIVRKDDRKPEGRIVTAG